MAETTSSSGTVQFAIGSYVALKLLESLGNHLSEAAKSHIKAHAGRLAEKHKHLFTKKRVVVLALGAVAVGAGYYFWKLEKAKELAAADAAANAQPSGEEMIASAMPDLRVTLW